MEILPHPIINSYSKILADYLLRIKYYYFIIVSEIDLLQIKKFFDSNSQNNKITKTKVRILFDGVPFNFFENIVNAHSILNDTEDSNKTLISFDTFYQIISIYGFLPLSNSLNCITLFINSLYVIYWD